jgi:DNA-directed RNA polymerase subunit RPC12/RpoP
MTDVDSNEIEFQCLSCGNDLRQTIGQLKAEKRMICPGCGIGINIDTNRLANAAEEIQKAIEKSPPEITTSTKGHRASVSSPTSLSAP